MSDLISRQAVLDELEKWDWQDLYLPIHFKQILDDIPSVENKGEWIDKGNGSYVCSNCKTEWTTSQIEKMCFCPTCGADMRGE